MVLLFSFKGFTVSGLFNYQIGGKFYDGVYASMMSPSYGKSLHADALKSWNTAGGMATIPRIDISSTGNLNAQSSRFLIDASYISLRNFTIGYNFSKGLLSKMKFDQVKVYLSGENVFVKSKRKGLNPAESFNGTNSNIYVPNRIISGGINFTF